MSVGQGGQRLEIEDGLQVLEVALIPEGTSDPGRVNEAITAREAREVWALGASDPSNAGSNTEGEAELNVTRDESSIDRPEVSTEVANGAAGHSFNETVWEYGYYWNTHDTSTSRDQNFVQTHVDVFPVPIIWQEDETWHFTAFQNSPGGGFATHEIRVYFTQSDRQVVPLSSRVV